MIKNAFAIMPFNEIEDEIYSGYIKKVFQQNNIKIKRADENISSRNVIEELIQQIDEADIILADITKHSANVFYELAVAHALNKPTIMITRDVDNMPYDLMQMRSIPYSETPKGMTYLVNQIDVILKLFNLGRYEFSNPVVDSLVNSPFGSVLRTNEVINLESSAKMLVCVITPDIQLGPSDFLDVMTANIKSKNIEYRYLISDLPGNIDEFKAFQDKMKLEVKRDRFKGRVIDSKYVESDITFIDPNSKYENGFILAPPEQPDFHFKIVGSNLVRLKNRFNSLWHEATEIF